MITHKTKGNLRGSMIKVSRNSLNLNLSSWIKHSNSHFIISFVNEKLNSDWENEARQALWLLGALQKKNKTKHTLKNTKNTGLITRQ